MTLCSCALQRTAEIELVSRYYDSYVVYIRRDRNCELEK